MRKKGKHLLWTTPLFIVYMTSIAFARPTFPEAWNAMIDEYNVIISGFIGLSVLTSLLIFIIHFMRLGAIGNNPGNRSKVIQDLMVTGITTALLGAIGTIYAILYYTSFGIT